MDSKSSRWLPKSRKSRRILITVLLLVAWTSLAWAAAVNLIVSVPLEQADLIVVLSGSATYKERATKAAELYRARVGKTVILMNDNRQGGWSKEEQRNPYFYERARQQLIVEGVLPEDIKVLAEPVYSTHDEAVLLRRNLESNAFSSMILVTSAYHSKRALWTMRRSFQGTPMRIGVEPVPTGFQTPAPATWWFYLQGWENVPLEYMKMGYYWLRY